MSQPASYPGRFVAFEGGEGAGKSTQARLLREHLEGEGRAVVPTFEPGDTAVGQHVRRIVLDPATGALDGRTEALLYNADKAEHVATVVLPALQRGAVVVTDRYVDSTLAYQGAGRSLDENARADLQRVARWATRGLVPDLTVLLDVDPTEAFGRFTGRDRMEAESGEFHQRVRHEFLRLAASDPARYLVLDAAEPREKLAEAVRRRVAELLA